MIHKIHFVILLILSCLFLSSIFTWTLVTLKCAFVLSYDPDCGWKESRIQYNFKESCSCSEVALHIHKDNNRFHSLHFFSIMKLHKNGSYPNCMTQGYQGWSGSYYLLSAWRSCFLKNQKMSPYFWMNLYPPPGGMADVSFLSFH